MRETHDVTSAHGRQVDRPRRPPVGVLARDGPSTVRVWDLGRDARGPADVGVAPGPTGPRVSPAPLVPLPATSTPLGREVLEDKEKRKLIL